MDRQDDRNDELDGHEPGGSHGRAGKQEPGGRPGKQEPGGGAGSEPTDARAHGAEDEGEGEGTYPPRTEEEHVAGGREPVERSSAEPESSRLEDRTRIRDIMKRVNDALHRVRPKK